MRCIYWTPYIVYNITTVILIPLYNITDTLSLYFRGCPRLSAHSESCVARPSFPSSTHPMCVLTKYCWSRHTDCIKRMHFEGNTFWKKQRRQGICWGIYIQLTTWDLALYHGWAQYKKTTIICCLGKVPSACAREVATPLAIWERNSDHYTESCEEDPPACFWLLRQIVLPVYWWLTDIFFRKPDSRYACLHLGRLRAIQRIVEWNARWSNTIIVFELVAL